MKTQSHTQLPNVDQCEAANLTLRVCGKVSSFDADVFWTPFVWSESTFPTMTAEILYSLHDIFIKAAVFLLYTSVVDKLQYAVAKSTEKQTKIGVAWKSELNSEGILMRATGNVCRAFHSNTFAQMWTKNMGTK